MDQGDLSIALFLIEICSRFSTNLDPATVLAEIVSIIRDSGDGDGRINESKLLDTIGDGESNMKLLSEIMARSGEIRNMSEEALKLIDEVHQSIGHTIGDDETSDNHIRTAVFALTAEAINQCRDDPEATKNARIAYGVAEEAGALSEKDKLLLGHYLKMDTQRLNDAEVPAVSILGVSVLNHKLLRY